MGDDTNPQPTRRRVLKTTTAALGTGLMATGTAAAKCSAGESGTLLHDYVLLDDPDYGSDCAGDAVGPTAEKGREFAIYEVCPDEVETDNEYVKVYSVERRDYRWISSDFIEC